MIISGFVTIDGERRPAIFELDDVKSDVPLRMAKGLWIPHDQEWTLMQVPEFDDPGALRFAGYGIGKGKICGNDIRADGKQEETTLLQFKRDERERDNPHIHSGEMTLHCRNGRGAGDGMELVQEWRHDYTHIKKAVIDRLVVTSVSLRGTEV